MKYLMALLPLAGSAFALDLTLPEGLEAETCRLMVECDVVPAVVPDPVPDPDPIPDPTPDPVPPEIPFGDVPALQSMGLLQEYFATKTVNVDTNIDWTSTAGERGEIGLIPEDHAAFLAGQTELLPTILEVAKQPPPDGHVAHSHKPNLYWLPYLMTGDPVYVANAEAVYKKHRDWHQEAYDSAFTWKCVGRELAWSLRNLAQLAYLQNLGVTQEQYYIPAFNATRDYYLEVIQRENRYKNWHVLGFGAWTWDTHGFTGWTESMVGQALSQVVLMGFEDWRPITQWHYQHLKDRINKWAFKALDHNHVFFYKYPQCAEASDYPSMRACMDISTHENTPPYAPNKVAVYDQYPDDALIPYDATLGNHQPYALYAYGWAALAEKAGIDSGLAKRIKDAINARNDQWGWDINNSYLIADSGPPPVEPPPVEPPPDGEFDFASLPIGEWVATASAPVAEITEQLNAAGFTKDKYKGTVTGSFSAWVGAAKDFDGGYVYIPWGGGHGDSSLNGIWRLNLKTLKWDIEQMPSDPNAPGYEWTDEYWNSNSYTVYDRTVEEFSDRLPDGMPTSRHQYGGVWFDTRRNTVNQSRLTLWSHDVATKNLTGQLWVDDTGKTWFPSINHQLFYDEERDKVVGMMRRWGYDYWGFIEYDPETKVFRNIGAPIAHVGHIYWRHGRKIYGLSPTTVGEKWAEFDMDTKTWESGDTTGLPFTYSHSEEMQVAVYVPQWGKVLRKFRNGDWYLYDLVTKVNEPYTPVGDAPHGHLTGNKAFYYPEQKTIVYIEVSGASSTVKLMRVE